MTKTQKIWKNSKNKLTLAFEPAFLYMQDGMSTDKALKAAGVKNPGGADYKAMDFFAKENGMNIVRLKKHNQPWSKSDTNLLHTLKKMGDEKNHYSVSDLAWMFGRTEFAIYKKLEIKQTKKNKQKKLAKKIIIESFEKAKHIDTTKYKFIKYDSGKFIFQLYEV